MNEACMDDGLFGLINIFGKHALKDSGLVSPDLFVNEACMHCLMVSHDDCFWL